MKRFGYLFIIGLILLIITACGSTDTEEETESKEDNSIVVEHELGETEVEKNPEKVVVFDFGTLDTLDKLDIDVAGVPQSNIPSYLEKFEDDQYENVGSLKEPDFEKISEIDPDLIIISGRQAELYDQLEELAPTIYLGVDTSRYMDSFEENVQTIGEIFDKEEEVKTALEEVEEQIDQVRADAEASDKDALIILANDDKISAYGPESRFGLIHDVFEIPAADEGIEVSTHGQNVSFEYVVKLDPDLLYVVDRGAAIGEESGAKQIVENDLMTKTKAMTNDDIYYLEPDYWYLSGGGLTSVSKMIEEIDASLK